MSDENFTRIAGANDKALGRLFEPGEIEKAIADLNEQLPPTDIERKGWTEPRVYSTSGRTPSGKPATTFALPLKEPADILSPEFLRYLADCCLSDKQIPDGRHGPESYEAKVYRACADRIETDKQIIEGFARSLDES